jgi:hypothetical protein
MSGIMMLADPDWLAFHEQNSVGKLAVFYASPHKRTEQDHLAPLFCVHPGKLPRDIVAVGRIQAQVVLDQDDAWGRYGASLGAQTEAEWREQAAAVLENSRKTYAGNILAIELVDFRPFPGPVSPETVGFTDTGWSDKKGVDDKASTRLLRLLEGEDGLAASEGDGRSKPEGVGAGFGKPEENKEVEEAAIAAVRRQYELDGWSVRSVEREKCGFDLKCSKDTIVQDVEVKGARGTVQSFLITAGEVAQARTNPNFVLVVVTSALSTSPVLNRYSGCEFCRRFGLSVVQYRAVLRP